MNDRFNAFLVSLLICACNPDKGDTAGDTTSGETGSSDGTVGMSSNPTTGDVGASSSSAGSDSVTASASATSLEGSSDEGPGETGGTEGTDTGNSESEGGTGNLCKDFCAKGDECGSAPGGAMCPGICAEGLQMGPECGDAFAALLECSLGMTCEEYTALIEDEDPGPCAEEFAAQMEACAGSECEGSVGTNPDGTECEYSVSCPDTMTMTMNCDVTTCTCLLGDEVVGECAAEMVCMDLGGIDTKAADCCGF